MFQNDLFQKHVYSFCCPVLCEFLVQNIPPNKTIVPKKPGGTLPARKIQFSEDRNSVLPQAAWSHWATKAETPTAGLRRLKWVSVCFIPATPGGGGVGPPTENGLSIFDPDDALATV